MPIPYSSVAAIDFDTADKRDDSAVSIGIVMLSGPRPLRAYYSLVAPVVVSERFLRVHGISRLEQESAHSFAVVWNKIRPALGNAPLLLAHNASFDRRVLRGMLHANELPALRARFWCTLEASRCQWPGERCDLASVAIRLGLAVGRTHNALDDALLVASIGPLLQKNPVAKL